MIDYRRAGTLPAKPHTVFRDAEGALLYEHCFTRLGFDGPFSILYHQSPPQGFERGRLVERLWPEREALRPMAETALRRQHLSTDELEPGGSPTTARRPMLFNADLTIGVLRPTVADDFLFANGDGDELFYIHEGSGQIHSAFGVLHFEAGDYVFVPRALAHRIEPGAEAQRWLWIECRTPLKIPTQYRNTIGQLRMDAPYTHRDFRGPELGAQRGSRELVSLRAGRFSRHDFRSDPFDCVGWDGSVFPCVFPIDRFSPRTGQVHLPPTVHGTFATDGSLICSFVPRATDFHPDSIPCPYPHSNVEVDEVIFYCAGNFTSRKGIGPGSVSLHPAGVPHGPHPGAYEASIGTSKTEELAVMIDTFEPLQMTAFGASIEAAGYDETWRQ